MANESHKYLESAVTVAQAGTKSSAFSLQTWTTFLGVYFPAMDDGGVGLEYSMDGTNYVPILDPVDGDDLLIVKSGSDPGWIDISDFIRAIPRGTGERFLRFSCAAQDPAITITITEAS